MNLASNDNIVACLNNSSQNPCAPMYDVALQPPVDNCSNCNALYDNLCFKCCPYLCMV